MKLEKQGIIVLQFKEKSKVNFNYYTSDREIIVQLDNFILSELQVLIDLLERILQVYTLELQNIAISFTIYFTDI